MFGFFSKKRASSPPPSDHGEVGALTPEAPPHLQVLHLILEQSLSDRAAEVLLQYDALRHDFAVYFKLGESYEQVLAPPASLFEPMQAMLVAAAGLSLPEDEGQFVLPRASGGRLRFSVAIEDQGATMALAMLGYV